MSCKKKKKKKKENLKLVFTNGWIRFGICIYMYIYMYLFYLVQPNELCDIFNFRQTNNRMFLLFMDNIAS